MPLYNAPFVSTYIESATTTAGTAWPITSSQLGDLTSLSVPPGTWDIQGMYQASNSGAVTTTQLQIGISTTSGNSSTGLNFGQNYFLYGDNPAIGTVCEMMCPPVRITVVTTTTYYLKAQANTSTTNLQYLGYRLSAIKVGN
jgi:hypothetical protein